MAGRSQHPVQIMENQTRFDLNVAIESWRNELTAQPNLASDDRHELEAHLCDAIAGFRQRGLNEEESFWLARRRVGQPQQIGEEFVKANPAIVWRERGFWMASAILLAFLWNEFAGILCCVISNSITSLSFRFGFESEWIGLTAYFGTGLLMLLNILPLLGVAILLAKGRVREDFILNFFARKRFLISTLVSLWITVNGVMFYLNTLSYNNTLVENNNLIRSMPLPHGAFRLTIDPQPAWTALSHNLIFPLLLLALVLWLMPPQNRKTPNRA